MLKQEREIEAQTQIQEYVGFIMNSVGIKTSYKQVTLLVSENTVSFLFVIVMSSYLKSCYNKNTVLDCFRTLIPWKYLQDTDTMFHKSAFKSSW